ncbi:paeninodin family lasso peptide [Priestia aryabhattai]|nr:paeninodin family lasso peptide [Priestia aryabhattai]MBZ6489044.1 paeninodin family lasso peptide [Priestia aryabhattai]
MKKVWEAPTLEVLDISMTMMGPGKKIVDAVFSDEDETVVLHRS